MKIRNETEVGSETVCVFRRGTLVLGSGAAGLCAAVRLHAKGVRDLAILTEGLSFGTSINAGSDKQTYYKLGLYGDQPDSPALMAESYGAKGASDGRLALIESALSPSAFFHLVQLGVLFPCDEFGQFIGYKTDHDPCRRATSAGPYTSRDMTRVLAAEVRRRGISLLENRVAVKLISVPNKNGGEEEAGGFPHHRVVGLVAINLADGTRELWRFRNLVFAVGGPGGLYEASVYPESQLGAIGLALEIGAEAVSLPESQFGLASVTEQVSPPASNDVSVETPAPAPSKEFRWNVSGTYMQVIPRFLSTTADGQGDEREFLTDFFDSPGDRDNRVFLKGYQWPFDVSKTNGSSLIDLIVFHETIVRGRRVFLDYRTNPAGFDFDALSVEARDYLAKSDALFGIPFERLERMNPKAVELYRDHGVDLAVEPLEIRLCAQHNNGGLAVGPYWESTTVEGLFPIGEVAGTHGVARPGGSALNAGQVGAIRVAEEIAHRERFATKRPDGEEEKAELDDAETKRAIADALLASEFGKGGAENSDGFVSDWRRERLAFRRRMTRYGAHLRSAEGVRTALAEAESQYRRLLTEPIPSSPDDAAETLRNRQLLFAQRVYLAAIAFGISGSESGPGSRGSAAVMGAEGTFIHPLLPPEWRIVPENPAFRDKRLHSRFELKEGKNGKISHFWKTAPPIPKTDDWFENVWRDFRNRWEEKERGTK